MYKNTTKIVNGGSQVSKAPELTKNGNGSPKVTKGGDLRTGKK